MLWSLIDSTGRSETMMGEGDIKHVKVWSGWLRLSHLLIGVSVLLLLITGWLMANSPVLRDGALDVHYIGMALLLPGLLIRFWLMGAGRENERLSGLVPQPHELQAMWETLRCYLGFGVRPLPNWYAQNPLWKPVYLVIYMGLVIQLLSGVLVERHPVVLGMSLFTVHELWAGILLWAVLLHIGSVALHDFKNGSADASSMINGYRLFTVQQQKPEAGAQFISVDAIKRSPKN